MYNNKHNSGRWMSMIERFGMISWLVGGLVGGGKSNNDGGGSGKSSVVVVVVVVMGVQ